MDDSTKIKLYFERIGLNSTNKERKTNCSNCGAILGDNIITPVTIKCHFCNFVQSLYKDEDKQNEN